MKLARSLLFLGVALIMAGTIASDASAQETLHFYENGEPIGATRPTMIFTGPFSWENEAGGNACESVEVEVEFADSTANVTRFASDGCETTGLMPAFGCEVTGPEALTADHLPWTITPDSTAKMDVTGALLHLPQKPGCAFGEDITMETTAGNHLYLNLVKPGGVEKLSISGTMVTPIGEVEVGGLLTGEAGLMTLVSH